MYFIKDFIWSKCLKEIEKKKFKIFYNIFIVYKNEFKFEIKIIKRIVVLIYYICMFFIFNKIYM